MEEMNNIAKMTKSVKEKPMDIDPSNAHSTMYVSKVRRGNALVRLDAAKSFQIRIVRRFS